MRLARTPGIGSRTFWQLIRAYQASSEPVARAIAAVQSGQRGLHRVGPVPAPSMIEKEWDNHSNHDAKLVTALDVDYPKMFRILDCPPPVVSLRGNSDLLTRPSVAIVGARNASLSGRQFAKKLAQDLGQSDLVIVSGLARGIDTAAHEGSLATGTIAVMAGGLDRVYPQENRGLYDLIATQGLLVSEQPWGTEPLAIHFPQRNRLISGLSLGVVVLEAAVKSGSLITAGYALDQARELMAVPGSPLDIRNRGSHQLIRQGAHLVETAHDIMAVLQEPLQRWSNQNGAAALASCDVLRAFDDGGVKTSPIREAQLDSVLFGDDASAEKPMQLQILDHLGGVAVSEDDLLLAIVGADSDVALGAHDYIETCSPAMDARTRFHLAVLQLELAGAIHKGQDGQISRIG